MAESPRSYDFCACLVTGGDGRLLPQIELHQSENADVPAWLLCCACGERVSAGDARAKRPALAMRNVSPTSGALPESARPIHRTASGFCGRCEDIQFPNFDAQTNGRILARCKTCDVPLRAQELAVLTLKWASRDEKRLDALEARLASLEAPRGETEER